MAEQSAAALIDAPSPAPRTTHVDEYADLQDTIREAYLDQQIGESEAAISMVEAQHLAEIAAAYDRDDAARRTDEN
jgi:hypothetical protein